MISGKRLPVIVVTHPDHFGNTFRERRANPLTAR